MMLSLLNWPDRVLCTPDCKAGYSDASSLIFQVACLINYCKFPDSLLLWPPKLVVVLPLHSLAGEICIHFSERYPLGRDSLCTKSQQASLVSLHLECCFWKLCQEASCFQLTSFCSLSLHMWKFFVMRQELTSSSLSCNGFIIWRSLCIGILK